MQDGRVSVPASEASDDRLHNIDGKSRQSIKHRFEIAHATTLRRRVSGRDGCRFGCQGCSSVSKIVNRHGWEFGNAECALGPGAVLLGGRDQMLTEATWQNRVVLAIAHYSRIEPFPQEERGTVPVRSASPIEPPLKFFTR